MKSIFSVDTGIFALIIMINSAAINGIAERIAISIVTKELCPSMVTRLTQDFKKYFKLMRLTRLSKLVTQIIREQLIG